MTNRGRENPFKPIIEDQIEENFIEATLGHLQEVLKVAKTGVFQTRLIDVVITALS